ncbi:Hypothetical predicted protein [Podarcis lilfordi]|uniref:Uncharacterized protein n=1 Tax=Podarcis lilfordi TaxID=74358 RepID=A0AA35L0Y2_9SAUR|nr:Hypothetical predicted protein [Podarcis lilfordi]
MDHSKGSSRSILPFPYAPCINLCRVMLLGIVFCELEHALKFFAIPEFVGRCKSVPWQTGRCGKGSLKAESLKATAFYPQY